jgi:ectoine hydroxylase-related dioxygenase (phytanoyl-CoA dioxygenase family)
MVPDNGAARIRHLMSNPAVQSFTRDPRLFTLANSYLGSNAVSFRAALFDKSPQTNWLIPWHQDTALPLATIFVAPGWGPWSNEAGVNYAHAPGWALARVIVLRVHLDASASDNGPLRVIPNSHIDGVLSGEAVLQRVSESEDGAVECLTPRGGVVAMRPLIIHSSSKVLSSDPRRALHIEYAGSLDFGGGIRLAVS